DDLEHGHPQDPESAPGSGPGVETEALLAELAAARGVRQPLSAPDHSEPMLWDDAAHPAGASETGEETEEETGGGDVVALPHSARGAGTGHSGHSEQSGQSGQSGQSETPEPEA